MTKFAFVYCKKFLFFVPVLLLTKHQDVIITMEMYYQKCKSVRKKYAFALSKQTNKQTNERGKKRKKKSKICTAGVMRR